MIDFRSLIKAGVHFGHQTSRWNPKMAAYIWGHKNNVHLIDVSKTAHQLEKAAKFLESVAAEGKTILFVGTKKAAQEVVATAATNLKMPFVSHRWIGGTLSNYYQVKKSVTKLMHLEDVITKTERSSSFYTKKEMGVFQKMVDRLRKNVGGISNTTWPLGAIVLVDVRKESSALREAAAVGVPIVALVDTNGDPSLVDYVVPGNDDAPRAIKVIIDYLAQAVERGKEIAATKPVKTQEEISLKELPTGMMGLEAEEEEAAAKRRPVGAVRARPSRPQQRAPYKKPGA